MCGISGIFYPKGVNQVDENLLKQMNASLAHRGPDDAGYYLDQGIGLAHRRLSIIDLSGGHQPMFNEDNSVVVVFNGEIYNFHQLAQQLADAGHRFRTNSDTETILHAWEEWGESCVQRFRGMFAFAIWDKHRNLLFLARDRLGIKPLYYTLRADGALMFASELKALMVDSSLPREIDPFAVEEYFAYGYIPCPRSIFKGVRKLPPGHTLTLARTPDFSLPEPRQYWDLSFRDNGLRESAEIANELVERLSEATRMRLMSEVPLGAFLSGGVDSSAIVALMAGLSQDPVNTCSISFDDPRFDESAYATQIAERYRTRHFTEKVDADDFALIDSLAEIYDEPFADSSAIPTYRVCQLARSRVKVCLSGDGGDEIFAGYRRYPWHLREEQVRALIPLSIRRPLFTTLAAIYPKADWAPRVFRAKSTFSSLACESIEGYFNSVSQLADAVRYPLFSRTLIQGLQGYHAMEVLRGHERSAPEDPLSKAQYLDCKTYLPEDILTKVDRASMAHGLEVRVPILDHEFVDWVSGLPSKLKLHQGQGKFILKKALEPLISNETLYRPKQGFSVPLAIWFRGPLRDKVRKAVLSEKVLDTRLFDDKRIRWTLDQHETGLRDFSTPIWSLLMFAAFVERNG